MLTDIDDCLNTIAYGNYTVDIAIDTRNIDRTAIGSANQSSGAAVHSLHPTGRQQTISGP